MKKGIADHKIGDKFNDFLLIKEANRGVASNGKPFLTLILRDTTGEIDAKLWDISNEDETTYLPETIIKIGGELHQFRGRAQLKIKSIRLAQSTDGVEITDFIKKAPVAKETLSEKITAYMFEMENPKIQRIVRGFIKKYQEELLTYPAATKNHHEYVSGLAHHVVGMLAIGEELCRLYPQLNKDLLYAGIILHDIGKVKELSGTVTTTYTLEGKLLGHIPIMIEEIKEMAKELQIDGEEVTILKHLVLSHHGKAEWGSPKPPFVQEAEVLHFIDMLDAKMNMMDKFLSKTTPGEFTERMFAMDNRSFYKPSFEQN